MNINSSLVIQNVTLRDLDTYSCVAINRGGMAECTTSLALLQVAPGSFNSSCTTAIMSFQGTFWSEILQEVIVIITILGAAIAFVFSLLIMRVLATR